MERSLAALALTVSGILFALAIGSWWMQQTVFNPDSTRATAEAILADPDIRERFNTLISTWVAPTLGQEQATLSQFLEQQILSTRPGAGEAAEIVGRVHALVIGDTDRQVVITGPELVNIVRDQRAADADDLLLPFDTIGTLKTTNTVLHWTMLIAGGLGLLALFVGLVFRPDRREVKRAFAEFLLFVAGSAALFGYALPVHVLPAIDSRTWVGIAPRLAMADIELIVGVIGVCVVLGGLLLVSSGSTPRRQWSTPLAAHRYGGADEPRWSR